MNVYLFTVFKPWDNTNTSNNSWEHN